MLIFCVFDKIIFGDGFMKKSVLKGKLRNSIKATLMSGVVLLAAIPVISNGISFEVSAIEQKVLPEKYYKPNIRRCKKHTRKV